jgi:hypothetical protein
LSDPLSLSSDFTGATVAERAIAAVIVNIQKILLVIMSFLLRLNDCENAPAGRRQPAGGVVACRHMSKRGVSAAEILVIGKAELIAQVSTLA